MFKPWMTAEEKIMLLLCRINYDDECIKAIQHIIDNNDVDLESLQNICMEQRVYPQYVKGILETPLSEIADRNCVLKCEVYKISMQMYYRKYKQELLRIHKILKQKGIAFFVMKGISYFGGIYPAIEDRSLGDIDIVVEKSQVMDAIHALKDSGYSEGVKQQNWNDEKYTNEISKNLHIAELFRNDEYEIEIHVATYYYTGLDLKQILKRVENKSQELMIPDIEDVFYIACVHAWHHFPLRKNPLLTAYNKIGQLVDVYQGYLAMRRKYSYEEIMNRAAEQGVYDVVKYMIYVAFRVLKWDDIPNELSISNNEQRFLDWQCGSERISVEFRYLRKIETVTVSEQWFSKNSTDRYIYKKTSNESLTFDLKPMYNDENMCWGTNILEASSPMSPDVGIRIKLTWSEEDIEMNITPTNNLIWSKNNIFDHHASHIIVRIGCSLLEEPHYVLFQINSGVMKGYMWKKHEEWKTPVIPNLQIECLNKKNNSYSCKIPWSLIDINEVFNNMKIYLDIQGHLVFEHEKGYMNVCWIAGNNSCMWDEIKNGSYLGSILLSS